MFLTVLLVSALAMAVYAVKRITRSWALFIAFFVGLTLAVSLFTGTLVGTDAIGAQTVQAALTNIPVDIVAAKSSKNVTSASVDASLASISTIPQITHVEAMYRLSAQVWDVDKNFTSSFPILALSDGSALFKDAVFSNSQGTLGANQTIIEEGSMNASKYSVGDTVTLRIRVQSQTRAHISEERIPLTIIDYLKNKIVEIDGQVAKLEVDFKADRITSDAYVAAKLKLSQGRESFKEELHKLGVTIT